MCGIVAVFARTGAVDEEALRRARTTLRHRGPDEEGSWLSPDRRVGLAHTRLSIIDLVSGQQPVANEDGSVVAVVNGELYDHERVQRELEERGHRLRGRSDSEILVHLYEELGAHAVHRLNGEFAFVLWDAARRTLLAGRDRFGIKPLVYAVAGDALYIASEAKALFAAGVPARWDAEAVLQACYVPTSEQTLFAGVRSVAPGGLLRATDRAVDTTTYWDLELPRAGEARMDAAEAVAGVRTHLATAVRRRLRADVPVSVYLSGGIDSSAILGLAAEAGRPLTGFTIAFAGDPQPEEARAREMAARCGAELDVLAISQRMLADAFAGAARAAEQMMMNGHGVGKYLLSRFVRDRGLKVVLTGEGADEMFAGYPAIRFDHLRERHGSAEAAIAALAATNTASIGFSMPSMRATSPQLDVVRRVLGSVPGFFEAFAETGEIARTLFADPLPHINPYLAILEDADARGTLSSRDAVARSLYMLTRTMLPAYMLTVLGDRMEMAHSIEGRVPFLDHELAEFVARVPSALKISDDTDKQILRDAVRDVVPESIYRREKHPLRAPVETDGPMWEMLQDMVRGLQLPFLDPARVKAFVERDVQGTPALNGHMVLLTRLASLCALQDAFRPS